MSNQQAKREPVKRYYLLAATLMAVGLAKFPWGQGSSMDPMSLSVSSAFIMFSVACVIRGRRNKRQAQA